MPIKTLGSLGKIRVGRVTGNTHICLWPNELIFAGKSGIYNVSRSAAPKLALVPAGYYN